ncbi:M90 metallopeptidase family protein [Portibacter lacus]|uniref:Uncharacterized protein n=1 Tax=Portibacter lacus TaxID=1099794 RepID=A0AA37SPT0_9BACT|nr:zinc-dependent peptidase [Portibacter lacus]GLR17942.1 hypothetical protein GCM10007940_25570 [Portibacter lacus]
MRGIRFSMLIALPFVLGGLYTGINLIYYGKDEHLFYLIPFFVVVLAIFFAKEEINYWYDEKFPPKLDREIVIWLQNFFPFYSTLDQNDRLKFDTRLALYLNARSFSLMLKEKKSIPEDFKSIIAAHGIQMTLGLKDFLIGDFDRIICYNHPFPTPQNKFLHTVEIHPEDGVILLSLETVMQSISKPNDNYNIAYHAYAEILLSLYSEFNNVEAVDYSLILPYSEDHILKLTGFTSLDPKVISLATFFINNEGFKVNWPKEYATYAQILNYAY